MVLQAGHNSSCIEVVTASIMSVQRIRQLVCLLLLWWQHIKV